jgi:hypothetical protein|tara:strand:+ start:27510 stop:28100 length:591 start_codon:yes stop_codon:yes gene_type:complete
MNAIIYDYETLSSVPATAPILTMAIYRFEFDRFTSNPYTLDEIVSGSKMHKFDVKEQVQQYGRIIQEDTVKWWSEQDKEVRDAQLAPKDDDLSIRELPGIFKAIYHKNDLAFTRGNTFDPIITDNILTALGVNPNFHPFYLVRDTRSMIDGMSYGSGLRDSFTPPDLEGVKLNKHDPRVDIALDILRMQSLARAIS